MGRLILRGLSHAQQIRVFFPDNFIALQIGPPISPTGHYTTGVFDTEANPVIIAFTDWLTGDFQIRWRGGAVGEKINHVDAAVAPVASKIYTTTNGWIVMIGIRC